MTFIHTDMALFFTETQTLQVEHTDMAIFFTET